MRRLRPWLRRSASERLARQVKKWKPESTRVNAEPIGRQGTAPFGPARGCGALRHAPGHDAKRVWRAAKNRGRITWIFATSRPDLVEVDRSGSS